MGGIKDVRIGLFSIAATFPFWTRKRLVLRSGKDKTLKTDWQYKATVICMARAVRLESFTHQYLVFRAYNLVRYDIKRIVLFSFVLFLCRFSLHRTSYQLLQLYYLYQQRFQITSTVKCRAWRKSKKSTLEESYVFYGFRVCGLMGHVRDLFITDWSLSSQTISELVTQSNVSSTLKFLDDQQESTSWAFVALTLAIYRVTQHAWSLEISGSQSEHLEQSPWPEKR